jgi:hypothetical protein
MTISWRQRMLIFHLYDVKLNLALKSVDATVRILSHLAFLIDSIYIVLISDVLSMLPVNMTSSGYVFPLFLDTGKISRYVCWSLVHIAVCVLSDLTFQLNAPSSTI